MALTRVRRPPFPACSINGEAIRAAFKVWTVEEVASTFERVFEIVGRPPDVDGATGTSPALRASVVSRHHVQALSCSPLAIVAPTPPLLVCLRAPPPRSEH